MTSSSRRMALRVMPPVLFAISLLAIWQFVVMLFDIREYVLPSPLQIVSRCAEEPTQLFEATLSTAMAAICGFGFSLLLGLAMACIFSQSTIVRNGLNPYAICLQTTPIISIAPLIILWIGEGFVAVVIISAIISFFPILTNTTAGLLQVPAGLQDLFRLYQASRWQRLWKLQFPNALPMIVTGMKTSGGLSVLGAIVGDFFAGYSQSQQGLGYLVYFLKDRDVPLMFGCIGLATLLGLTAFGAVSLVGDRLLLSWMDKKVSDP